LVSSKKKKIYQKYKNNKEKSRGNKEGFFWIDKSIIKKKNNKKIGVSFKLHNTFFLVSIKKKTLQ